MNWWILNTILWAVVTCGAAYGVVLAARTKRLNADILDQLAKTEAKLAEARKHLDVVNRDLTRAIGGLRWFGIRGNWTGDNGRAGRFAWTGGTDWPWLRARKAMGRFWTPEPGQEVKDGE